MSFLLLFSLFFHLSFASNCGNKFFGNSDDAYVVGGHDASPGAWPWQASLQTPNGFHFCGGSLIHKQWILTAAHCVEGKSTGSLKVVLGEHNLKVNEGHEQTFTPSQIISHERFKQGGWMFHDVALIKLNREAKLNRYVGLACLPERGDDEQGQTCFVSGWGYTKKTSDTTGISPNTLQQVSGPIWRWTDCKTAWGSSNLRLNPDVYCFGNKNGQNYGVCNGDSGGPMSCSGGDGWRVVGVAHFAQTRCQQLPGAYTKVEPYLDWIKQRVPIGDSTGPDPNPRPTPKPDGGGDSNKFQCTQAGDVVGVSGDCSSYVVCTRSNSGIKQTCPPGLLFNTKMSVCDWPVNVRSHRNDCS